MPTKKRATTRRWRALRGFGYPADIEIRKRIRAGEKIEVEERGPNVEIPEGATFMAIDLPEDVRESCLQYAKPVRKRKGGNDG